MYLSAVSYNWYEPIDFSIDTSFVIEVVALACVAFIYLTFLKTKNHTLLEVNTVDAPTTSRRRKSKQSKKRTKKAESKKVHNNVDGNLSKVEVKKGNKPKKTKRKQSNNRYLDDGKAIHVIGESYNVNDEDIDNGWIQVTSRSRRQKSPKRAVSKLTSSESVAHPSVLPRDKPAVQGSEKEAVQASEIRKPTEQLLPESLKEAMGGHKHLRLSQRSLDRLSKTSSGYISDNESSPAPDRCPTAPPRKLKKQKRVLETKEAQKQPLFSPLSEENGTSHNGESSALKRVVPQGALSHYQDLDTDGGTINFYGCELNFPSKSLTEPTRIYLDRWNRPEVEDGGGLVISPTIQCEPSSLLFKHPVHFTLPVCYMPGEREVKVLIEVSYDNVNWETLCVRRLAPGSKRTLEFDSNHFCRLRARVAASDAEQLLKYVVSVGFVKRDWSCSDPPLYNLLWCIHDDDQALTSKLREEMKNDDTYCYDRVLDPDTIHVVAGKDLKLSIRCGSLSIRPKSKIAVKEIDWRHQINRKSRFQLRKPTMQEQQNDFTLAFEIETALGDDTKDSKLSEEVNFTWKKSLLPRSNSKVHVQNINVQDSGLGINIDTQRSIATSGATTSPEPVGDEHGFFPAEDRSFASHSRQPSSSYTDHRLESPIPALYPHDNLEKSSFTPNGNINTLPLKSSTPKKKPKKSEKVFKDKRSPDCDEEPATSSSASLYHPTDSEKEGTNEKFQTFKKFLNSFKRKDNKRDKKRKKGKQSLDTEI